MMSDGEKFETLLPKKDVDLSSYESALNHAMNSDEIRNIALSGSYGSGKSSVIRSYESMKNDRKFLHISLARFTEEVNEKLKKADTAEEKDENGEEPGGGGQGKKIGEQKPKTKEKSQKGSRDIVNLLEGKIVNQLLHQIDPEKIRQSKFHVKTDGNRSGKIKVACFFTAFAFLLFYSIGFNTWKSFARTLPKTAFVRWMMFPKTRGYAILLCFILGGIALYRAMRSYGLLKMFKRIDVKGIVGVEVFEDPDDLYFDKYLNEVLYLFEHSGADAIVFEDLDRYEVMQIFEKLKEISDLLYLRKQQRDAKKQAKMLARISEKNELSSPKFFYLIRDDVFTSSNRSKFFDFIIPVVPVVDTENAYDLLEERLTQSESEKKFDRKFLRNVSLYLPDLRLINNIVNEYTIFSKALGKSALERDPNNQLAIIIYKNLFPRDFERLQHGNGYVYGMLRKKTSLIIEHRAELEAKREELQERQERAHEEVLKSTDELNALFLPHSSDVYLIDGDPVDPDWSRTEVVKKILSAERVEYHRGYQEVSELQQEMESNAEYQSRKKSVEDGEKNKKKELDREIKRIDIDLRLLNTRKLYEVLTDENNVWQLDVPFTDVTSNPAFDLLKYLIWNGYIDEDYSIYVSFFYPNSLTVRDRNFLLSVSKREKPNDGYELDSPERVLDWLEESSFSRQEVENLSLFEYLLEKKKERYLVVWLHSLNNKYDRTRTEYSFVVRLWKETKFSDYLVKLINSTVPNWFREWTELGGLLDDAEWQRYAVETILYSTPEVLEKVNDKNWLTNEISDCKSFLQIDDPQIDKLVSGFKTLKVSFRNIVYREEDMPLVRRVYEEDLYELNPAMLELWLAEFYDAPRGGSLKESYNYLVSKSDEPLSRRVEENFNEYMEAILDQTECRFADRAEIAADLLDHESISKNLAASYIQRLDVKMKMLEMVKNKAFWPMLLDNDIVPPSNKNLFDYYMEFCAQDKTLDDHFAGMLKRNAEKIKWKWREMTDYLEIDEANILLKKLLCCDMLSTKEYRAVLQPIGAHPDSFSIAGLTEEYITVIIDLGFIRVTKGNLNFIRSHYPNQVTLFLMQKKGVDIVILAEQNEIELNDEEVREMLESSDLQIDIAIRLMKAYGRPISIENIECSDAICAAIVENNFNEDDIPWIFVNYDELKSLTKQAFLKTVKRYGQEVYDVARREERIPEAVYATMIQELDTEDLRDLREYLPNPDFEAVCTTNQKPKFSGTEENRVILDYFKKQEWISSYQKLTDGRYQAFSTQKKLIEA